MAVNRVGDYDAPLIRRSPRRRRPFFEEKPPNALRSSLLGTEVLYRRMPTYLSENIPQDSLRAAHLIAYLSHVDNVPIGFTRIVNNIYEIEPQQLADIYREEDDDEKEWLFYTMRGRKYMNETVIYQASGDGYWKFLNGSDEAIGGPIHDMNFGFCKTFGYYSSNAGQLEAAWVIEEYRLADNYYGYAFDDWVVCKLCQLRDDPVVNVVKPPLATAPPPPPPPPLVSICIPGFWRCFAKPPTPGHCLIDPTTPPMLYVILLCAITNRGDEIDKGGFSIINNMIMRNIYEINPEQLAEDHGDNQEWFLFTIRGRERENDTVLNRAVGDGYWLLDVSHGRALTTQDGASLGVRRTFVFYTGKHPTSWTMHEFRLNQDLLRTWNVVGDWVLCQIWNNDMTTECKLLDSLTIGESAPHCQGHQKQGARYGNMYYGRRQRRTPTPVQLQILESIFNKGNGTPRKERIKEITSELSQHGPIAPIKVYNWFQHRRALDRRNGLLLN